MSRLGTNGGNQVTHILGDKFQPIVGSYIFYRAAQGEQICECTQTYSTPSSKILIIYPKKLTLIRCLLAEWLYPLVVVIEL